MKRPSISIIGLLLSLAGPLGAQRAAPPPPPPPPPPVPVQAMVGQSVALMPLTLVGADPELASDTIYLKYQDRRTTLLWADSLIGSAFTERAPEVKWVLPPQLRKIARRSPGIVGDPDQMGQAMLRSPKLKELPDPLRAPMRNLMALVGGRVAMVPAALSFGRDNEGKVHADLTLVAADTRSGKILWRSLAVGSGATPDQALQAALFSVLPI